MNLLEKESLDLAYEYKKRLTGVKDLAVVIAPTNLYLKEINKIIKHSPLLLAAQNVAAQKKGSFTGEVSAAMLKETGCRYVLVGHSERRQHLSESNELVNQKINQCYNGGLIPVLCLGETMEEKTAGRREAVLVQQIHSALEKVNGLPENNLLLAYEPVWAIGTGEFIEMREFEAVQRIIKRTISSLYSERFYNERVALLYGGSVNSINAKEFWQQDYLHGLLVGTASLDIEEIYNITIEAS